MDHPVAPSASLSSSEPIADALARPTATGWAERAEAALLDAARRDLATAPDIRFDAALFQRAARAVGLSEADSALLAPNGPRDLAALLWRRHDGDALAILAGTDPATLKVRQRIRAAVIARVDCALADEAAVRACSLFLGRPANAGLALKLGWATSDTLWRWAGDTATDENHYSKRLILSAVLGAVLAVRLWRGREAALDELDARLAQVMIFERLKAKTPRPVAALHMAAATLGRWRYGVRDMAG